MSTSQRKACFYLLRIDVKYVTRPFIKERWTTYCSVTCIRLIKAEGYSHYECTAHGQRSLNLKTIDTKLLARTHNMAWISIKICSSPSKVFAADVAVPNAHCVLGLCGLKTALGDTSPKASGIAAWYSIVTTVLLANKSTSLIPIHHVAAIVALVNSVLHGYTCFIYGGQDTLDLGGNETLLSTVAEPTESQIFSDHGFHGEEPNLVLYSVDGAVNAPGSIMTIIYIVMLLGLSSFDSSDLHFSCSMPGSLLGLLLKSLHCLSIDQLCCV